MILEIERRLEQWSYYLMELELGNLGYSDKSSIAALIDGGASTNKITTGTCLIYKYSDAQQIEGWIRQMGREHPDYESAIRAYYRRKTSVSMAAKALGLSVRRLRERVYGAKIWLCGRLSALESVAQVDNGIFGKIAP